MNVAVSEIQDSAVEQSGITERLIPERFPPLIPPPQPTWRPHWAVAPLLLPLVLIFPRRLSGPLGAAGIWVALWVHLVGVFAGLFALSYQHTLTYLAGAGTLAQWSDCADAFRYVIRDTWLQLMRWNSNDPQGLKVLLLGGLGESALLGVALILMPWSIAGETRWRGYCRSLKIVWWSTAAVLGVPLLLNQVALIGLTLLGAGPLLSHRGFFELQGFLIPVGIVWMLHIILALGDRYAGPNTGRLFQPRALRCVCCGYELTRLYESGRCPECDLAVKASLPEFRETLPFVAARSLLGRWRTFWKTEQQTCQAGTFGMQLRVYDSRRAARQFVLLVSVMLGLVVVVISGVADAPFRDRLIRLGEYGDYLSASILVFQRFVVGHGGALIVVLIGGSLVSGFGFSEPERKTTVFAFASGWLLRVAVATLMGCVWYWMVQEHLTIDGSINFAFPRVRISYELMLIVAGFIPAAMLLLLWPLHVHKMLRATQYANA